MFMGLGRGLSGERLTVGVEGERMVVQWWVMAVSRRGRAVPSSSVDVVDGGDVLRSGDTDDVERSFFFLYPLSLSWLGCAVEGHKVAAGRWESSRAPGAGAFIAKARPWSLVNDGWRSRGDRRASNEAGLGF